MVFGAEKVYKDIEGIDLLKKAEKIDPSVNLAADRLLDDRDLKKMKILQLKEGVKRVDRHGFADEGGRNDELDSHREAIKSEYYHKMLELIKIKRLAKLKEEEEEGHMADEESGEEGEQEMSEGEMGESEMDEEMGESEQDSEEWLSDDDEGEKQDEKPPKAVPIDRNKIVSVNHERKEESSSVSDVDPDEFSSSDEYDSDELAVDTTKNPHGFVFSNML